MSDTRVGHNFTPARMVKEGVKPLPLTPPPFPLNVWGGGRVISKKNREKKKKKFLTVLAGQPLHQTLSIYYIKRVSEAGWV